MTTNATPAPNMADILGEFADEVVQPIQPYQARKEYQCPGCESVIDRGVGHVVVVPHEAPDLRRHWHRGCWFKELRISGRQRSIGTT